MEFISNNQHKEKYAGRKYLIQIVIARLLVLLIGLNLADRLDLFPDSIGPFAFLAFFNTLTLVLTAIFLFLLRFGRNRKIQLYLHLGADLILTTVLVSFSGGVESPFVSIYLLVIIYCCLSLGRNGGFVGTALSTILYAGAVTANNIAATLSLRAIDPDQAFRIALHTIGFWAVAFLGMYLHNRLRAIEYELKEKIDSLRQLQKLNEHIVSSIRSGLITTDLHGRIAVFNNAAEELTGKMSNDCIGEPIHQIIGEDLWAQVKSTDLLHSAKPLRHETWISMPGGENRYLGFSVSPLMDQNHELLGYILSFQDLTDIYRLEEEVRLKDRMAAIGRMAAGIAHEIRNPLAAMRGSVEILQSHAPLPKVDERLLDILIRESDRLNKVVEDFLNFARPKHYAKQSIDLVPILRDSVTLLRNSPEIKEKHSVVLETAERKIPVYGSSDQLNQVFWNLAQNALRAMPNGGELKISTHKNRDGWGLIEFMDTGIGMSSEELEKLFQPFHSEFEGGLGLGLSILFQIVEDHKGKVFFESEKGKGTRVSISFPPEKLYARSNIVSTSIN
ncbi:MAG: ATP-binding protein [Acidobacteriota bacterium]